MMCWVLLITLGLVLAGCLDSQQGAARPEASDSRPVIEAGESIEPPAIYNFGTTEGTIPLAAVGGSDVLIGNVHGQDGLFTFLDLDLVYSQPGALDRAVGGGAETGIECALFALDHRPSLFFFGGDQRVVTSPAADVRGDAFGNSVQSSIKGALAMPSQQNAPILIGLQGRSGWTTEDRAASLRVNPKAPTQLQFHSHTDLTCLTHPSDYQNGEWHQVGDILVAEDLEQTLQARSGLFGAMVLEENNTLEASLSDPNGVIWAARERGDTTACWMIDLRGPGPYELVVDSLESTSNPGFYFGAADVDASVVFDLDTPQEGVRACPS